MYVFFIIVTHKNERNDISTLRVLLKFLKIKITKNMNRYKKFEILKNL